MIAHILNRRFAGKHIEVDELADEGVERCGEGGGTVDEGLGMLECRRAFLLLLGQWGIVAVSGGHSCCWLVGVSSTGQVE